MRKTSTQIRRGGRLVLCLTVAFGCAPDQFVSMGSDVGGAAVEKCTSPSTDSATGNLLAAGGSGPGAASAGGMPFGAAGSANATGATGSAIGGSASPSDTAASGGTNGLVMGVLR